MEGDWAQLLAVAAVAAAVVVVGGGEAEVEAGLLPGQLEAEAGTLGLPHPPLQLGHGEGERRRGGGGRHLPGRGVQARRHREAEIPGFHILSSGGGGVGGGGGGPSRVAITCITGARLHSGCVTPGFLEGEGRRTGTGPGGG